MIRVVQYGGAGDGSSIGICDFERFNRDGGEGKGRGIWSESELMKREAGKQERQENRRGKGRVEARMDTEGGGLDGL